MHSPEHSQTQPTPVTGHSPTSATGHSPTPVTGHSPTPVIGQSPTPVILTEHSDEGTHPAPTQKTSKTKKLKLSPQTTKGKPCTSGL